MSGTLLIPGVEKSSYCPKPPGMGQIFLLQGGNMIPAFTVHPQYCQVGQTPPLPAHSSSSLKQNTHHLPTPSSMGQAPPEVKSLWAPPYTQDGQTPSLFPYSAPKGGTNVPITTTATYPPRLRKNAPPQAGTHAPNCSPKLDTGSYDSPQTDSHRHPHFIAQAGQALLPAPNLEPLHAEFLLFQLPARGADLLLQPPLLLRTEDRELPAGRAGPPPPFPPSLLRGARGGSRGSRGCEPGGAAERTSGPRAGRGLRRR